MSTFWRPIADPADPGVFGGSQRYHNGKLSALWARCDICNWSGMFDNFTLYERGDECVTICETCVSGEGDDLAGMLEHDGWKKR